MATMNISLPDALKDFVEAEVATGLYANASDYVRDLIRHNMRRRDELIAAIEEGEASGWSERTLEDIIADGEKRFA